MTIRWTTGAEKNLINIVSYQLEHTPEHADRTVRRILQATQILSDFPSIGRLGNRRGTRELVLAPLPYIIVYAISERTVRILRIFDGRRDWKR